MAESVDATDLKSVVRKDVGVQVPLLAPAFLKITDFDRGFFVSITLD